MIAVDSRQRSTFAIWMVVWVYLRYGAECRAENDINE